MAILQHRINLDSPTFPLLSELLGRTIIVRGSDQTHPHTLATTIAADPPQLYYAHNVVPTPFGYQSIGYQEFIARTTRTDFKDIITVYEGSSSKIALIGITELGTLLVSTLANPAWREVTLSDGASTRGKNISFAFVRGITYLYVYKVGCYVYNFTTNTLIRTTLGGLNEANIYGVVGVNGYMLAYGVANSVGWSSPIDPTDFVPSLNTGAGAGNIEGAQGETIAAIAVQNGVIFFNAKNAVSANYQANQRFPFLFNVIVGCGGLSDPKFAAALTLDSTSAYAYTTSGLQAVNTRQAEFIAPEITEFLSGRRLEDFDESTLLFSTTTPNNVIKKKLSWIADRYLIVSYGDELLSHAIILDTMLMRLGKLKIDHVAIFEFTLYDQTVFETPKKSIGVLKADGSVVVVDTDIAAENSSGVILLGKYQYVRERWLVIEKVELENILPNTTFNLYDLVTYDGKTFQAPVAGYDAGNTGKSKSYLFHQAGVNHSLLGIGRFNLVSGVLAFHIHGKQ